MNNKTRFLLDCLIEQLAMFVMEDYNLSMPEALNLVFNSQLYDKINDLSTGLYYQSAAFNYRLLRREIAYGKIT